LEWCEDVGYTSNRHFRGGSWDNVAGLASVVYRDSYFPHYGFKDFGFRLARNPGN
jgi:formylglycine-generating enzyme required for sulfatase activity